MRPELSRSPEPTPDPVVEAGLPAAEKAANLQATAALPQAPAPEEEDFLGSFFSEMDAPPAATAPAAVSASAPAAQERETVQELREVEMTVENGEISFQDTGRPLVLAHMEEAHGASHLLEATPIVAERDLRQLFPVKDAEAALALAAMPHYEIGGNAGVRVGQLEMRWLAAEARTTLADTRANSLEMDEDGDAIVKGPLVEHHEAVVAEAEATIHSLVESGYLRPVRLSADEARAQGDINSLLAGELPGEWKGLADGVDQKAAFELTDAGIAAGRSLRGWDGKALEAGMVRLQGGQEMPAIVASESYALSAMLMENRSLAGVLRQGEMGAFYRAEIANLEYGLDQGADPVVTAGRLDAVVNSASFVALEQIEESVADHDAPLTTADLDSLSVASHRVLDKLPEALEVDLGEGPQWMSLDKAESRVLLARLDGVRMGAELIQADRAVLDARATRVADPDTFRDAIKIPGDNLAIRNALSVAKTWLAQGAVKGNDLRKEVMAMAKGAFGDPGTAMAKQILEAA